MIQNVKFQNVKSDLFSHDLMVIKTFIEKVTTKILFKQC